MRIRVLRLLDLTSTRGLIYFEEMGRERGGEYIDGEYVDGGYVDGDENDDKGAGWGSRENKS